MCGSHPTSLEWQSPEEMMFVCARCSSCLFKEKKNPILFICQVRRLTRQTWKSRWLPLKALFALTLWQLLTNCFFVSSFAKEWASRDWILIRCNSLLFLFWAKSHALKHVTHCKKYIIYCSFFVGFLVGIFFHTYFYQSLPDFCERVWSEWYVRSWFCFRDEGR